MLKSFQDFKIIFLYKWKYSKNINTEKKNFLVIENIFF